MLAALATLDEPAVTIASAVAKTSGRARRFTFVAFGAKTAIETDLMKELNDM